MARYTISHLKELAEAFDTYADDQIASMRWQSTQKSKRECEIRSAVWRDAANLVRECEIDSEDNQ